MPSLTRTPMNLQELKRKTPAELLAFAEELEIENASSLRKQDMLFAILKQLAENDVPISGDGVLEVLSDGFGFLRSPEANYLAGPDDIYVSPSQVRRFGLRTGDTVEGQIRSPRDGERYFALLKVKRKTPAELLAFLPRSCRKNASTGSSTQRSSRPRPASAPATSGATPSPGSFTTATRLRSRGSPRSPRGAAD